MTDRTTETVEIQVGHRAENDQPVTLPVIQVLTGRAFVTGKSGSGKSNTASVVIEELLEAGYPVLIVDADGEYYGLKETYELLHAGADEECDIQIGPDHAEKLASLALDENVPIVLDVSGYLDRDAANELVRETARHLFAKEKKLKKPFLLVVEEIHEYIPEGGGMDDTGRMLIKIGKRGRKHGLGLLGISQRPADVKKDFITQANWLVWHRLTWDNDTRVAGRVLGDTYADAVTDLGDGEAFLQTDWTEATVRRMQFRRKRTFDAGATPGLSDFERPELKSVSDTLLDELTAISEEADQREDRIDQLQAALERKDERIAELETQLHEAQAVSEAADQLATALADTEGAGTPSAEVASLKARIADLETQLSSLESQLDESPSTAQPTADGTTSDTSSGLDTVLESALADPPRSEETTEHDPDPDPDIDLEGSFDPWPSVGQSDSDSVQSGSSADPAGESPLPVSTPHRSTEPQGAANDVSLPPAVQSPALTAAIQAATPPAETARSIILALRDQHSTPTELAETVDVRTHHVWTLLVELRTRDLATRDSQGRYRLTVDNEDRTRAPS